MSDEFRRGTGGQGGRPLKEYGKPNTFGLAIAQKLAASGLTEAEYIQMARQFKADEKRFKAYIRYFISQGFNVVFENGRFVNKTEPIKYTEERNELHTCEISKHPLALPIDVGSEEIGSSMNQRVMEREGYVYILVNPAFTGFVKIGKTTNDPETRARQLSVGSGVPAPYAVAWDALVSDCDLVERLIHQHLAGTRSRKDREFFATPLKNAIAVASTIVASFSCETNASTLGAPKDPGQHELLCRPKRFRREGVEELITVAEDCPVHRAEAPPDKSPKTIARIGYEILIENPYKYTEREFYYELHVVRRNRPDLKYESYNIKRAPVVQIYGWGIHRNQDGRLALVAIESARYKELQETIKTSKAYRKIRGTGGA